MLVHLSNFVVYIVFFSKRGALMQTTVTELRMRPLVSTDPDLVTLAHLRLKGGNVFACQRGEFSETLPEQYLTLEQELFGDAPTSSVNRALSRTLSADLSYLFPI